MTLKSASCPSCSNLQAGVHMSFLTFRIIPTPHECTETLKLCFSSPICIHASINTHTSFTFTRRYSAAIKRPFAVRYDPFTCSMEVLDQPCKIQNALSQMREELKTLHSALEKLSSSWDREQIFCRDKEVMQTEKLANWRDGHLACVNIVYEIHYHEQHKENHNVFHSVRFHMAVCVYNVKIM